MLLRLYRKLTFAVGNRLRCGEHAYNAYSCSYSAMAYAITRYTKQPISCYVRLGSAAHNEVYL